MRSQNILYVLAVVLLSGSLIYIGSQLASNRQANNFSQGFVSNTISVAGEGKAMMAPDSMVISLVVDELGKTTEEAQTLANTKLNQVKAILDTYKIPTKDIQTANISISAEYDWTDNGRKLLGQRANQNLTIIIKEDNFAKIGGEIIDEVAKIGGVQINNTSFDIQDKNAAMGQARENAFQDAQEKAEQLAKAGGLRLQKPISISDNSINYYPQPYPMMAKNEAEQMARDSSMGGGLEISAGEMEVNVQIQVIFDVK